jgi:hypothetical protein
LTYYEGPTSVTTTPSGAGVSALTANQTLFYSRLGNIVFFSWADMSGTAGGNLPVEFRIGSIPTRFLPIRQERQAIRVNTAGTDTAGTAVLFTSGRIQIFASSGTGNFTNATAVIVYATTLSWTIS